MHLFRLCPPLAAVSLPPVSSLSELCWVVLVCDLVAKLATVLLKCLVVSVPRVCLPYKKRVSSSMLQDLPLAPVPVVERFYKFFSLQLVF